MRSFLFLFLLIALAASSCEDWRNDQQEDNLFDAANTFIRFDFGNTVNGIARDSVLLKRSGLDTLFIPVALSSPPRTAGVSVKLVLVSQSGNMQEGTHYVLLSKGEILSSNGTIQIAPGQYVQNITFAERVQPPAGKHRLRLELREFDPPAIHLGFPGSGRGRYFDLIYNE